MVKLDPQAVQRSAGHTQRGQCTRTERRPSRVEIQHLDDDAPAPQVPRIPSIQQYERVQAIHRRPARDVEEIERLVRCLHQRGREELRQQLGHILQSQPDRQHGRRLRNSAIDQLARDGAEIVRSQLEQIRIEPAEIAASRAHGSRQDRTPRHFLEHPPT